MPHHFVTNPSLAPMPHAVNSSGSPTDGAKLRLASEVQNLVRNTQPDSLLTLGLEQLVAIKERLAAALVGNLDFTIPERAWLSGRSSAAAPALTANADTSALDGDLLRLATAVQTKVRGASAGTIAKLGKQYLEGLKSAIEKAETELRGNRADDPWAGYDLNSFIDASDPAKQRATAERLAGVFMAHRQAHEAQGGGA